MGSGNVAAVWWVGDFFWGQNRRRGTNTTSLLLSNDL